MVTVTKGVSKCAAVESFHSQLKQKRLRLDGFRANACASVLKMLMTHQYGYVFNQPVDPISLNIPDYFDFISEPMDLGTIKSNLEKGAYTDFQDFAYDVRLTFSNAMAYNPPGNPVHRMALHLKNIFNERWNAVEAKCKGESEGTPKKLIIQKTEKKFPDSRQCCHKVSPVMKLLTSVEKQKLRKDLAAMSDGNMPGPVLTFLQRFGIVGQNKRGIEVDVDVFDGETAWELNRIVKSCVEERLSKGSDAENRDRGPRLLLIKCKKQRLVESQADSGRLPRNESHSRCEDALKVDNLAINGTTSCTMVDFSISESDGITGTMKGDNEDLHSRSHTPDASSREGSGDCGGDDLSYDEQLSPSKALRAAMLKSRFADTIFKARERTLLNQGEKRDPVKMQLEREKLERQQLEEKARIEAKVKAAEAARLRAEIEMKRKLERDREAARLALQQMERTVEIDENREILKDLEMFGYFQADSLDTAMSDAASSMGNPLERLGLFMKDDNLEDEQEDLMYDMEEGEIGG